MIVTWEVIRKDDGTHDILQDGTVVAASVPDRWLEEELARYGFCGQEYAGIRGKLNESGKFEFTYPFDRSRPRRRSV
jgi:hypothetical protein